MQKTLAYLLIFIAFAACTKPQPLPMPAEEVPTEEPEPEKKDSVIEYYYTPQTFTNSRSTHYLSSDVTPAFFLGRVWHLQDTVDHVELAALSYRLPDFDMIMYSTRIHLASQTIRPSYDVMRNFAKQHDTGGQTNSYVFQRSDFTDYAEIKRWIPNNSDVADFLQLAAVSDSTVIRKPTGVVLRTEAVAFSFAVDLAYVYEDMHAHLDAIASTGQSPYIITEVAYGKHAIIMAESDSAYAQVHQALDLLLNDKALSQKDEQVLATSRVMAYFRGGGKESFIKRAEGLDAIKSLASAYQAAWSREDNLYDYPLYYLASSLADYSLLRYNFSFDFLQKGARWVEN